MDWTTARIQQLNLEARRPLLKKTNCTKDYERTSNCGRQHLRKRNRLSIRLNLEHWHRPVYVRFGRSLATGKFTPDYKAIIIKDLSQDIWSCQTVEPAYYRVESLISRTLKWAHRLGRPVNGWSLEWMEITHSWASDTQKCIPRCHFDYPSGNLKSAELHCFSDASEKAYAASIYVCSIYEDGRCKIGWIEDYSRTVKETKHP